MGYIAGIASLVGTLASTGASIYGATQSSGAQQTNQLAVNAGHAINVARNKYLSPFTQAGYWNLNIPGMAQQQQQYGQPLAAEQNRFMQGQLTNMLSAVMPGYQGMFNQMGANVSSELAGNVPVDVQNQIQRMVAQQTVSGSGIGGGGGPGGAGPAFGMQVKDYTARDLGLTSLDLTGRGQAGLSSMLGMARNYLMPQLATPETLLPLSDLIAGEQWVQQGVADANLAMYNASLASALVSSQQQPTVPQGQQLGGAIGAGLQGLGQPTGPQGQTGYQQIGNLFGGIQNLFGGSNYYDPSMGVTFGSIPGMSGAYGSILGGG